MIPPQELCDMDNPEEHFLWALKYLPMVGGAPMVTHPDILRSWSVHFWERGFAHTDWLAGLADENGYIHVSQLPQQQKKMTPVLRGPRHDYNAAQQWVDMDTPEPEVIRLPDVSKYTPQENAAILAQYIALGMIPSPVDGRDTAQEINE